MEGMGRDAGTLRGWGGARGTNERRGADLVDALVVARIEGIREELRTTAAEGARVVKDEENRFCSENH